ncbi:MAG: exodeoxyribonuclease V subunit alpha [Holophaga sp.]|nr:exodeoxyribonuclease V subunit alpha [Holophaga sp.]
MSDEFLPMLKLHPAAATLPSKVLDLVVEQNQEASSIVMAWELAGLPRGLGQAEREGLFAICLALQMAQGQGHTRLALIPAEGSTTEALYRAFGLRNFEPKSFLGADSLAPLVGSPGEAKPLVIWGDWLYSHRLYSHECELANQIGNLRRAANLTVIPVGEEVFCDPVSLNNEQRQAVGMALKTPLTLVTGGPGTGKTSIVVSILRALLRQPGMTLEDIALAAPTGKAAQRMGEAIRNSLQNLKEPDSGDQVLIKATLEPKTLHRLLAWHPAAERFRHGPGNALSAKVVIVDEASMISQEHMCRLLGALAPEARLVLLGDADQLPSVEAGCAFRDMVASLAEHRVKLFQSYRMSDADPDGRNILSVAGVINNPNTGSLWEGAEPIHCRTSLEQLAFKQVELFEPSQVSMTTFLKRWFDQEVTGLAGFQAKAKHIFTFQGGVWGEGDGELLKALFDHFDQFRVLCALREADDLRGVQPINELLHKWMLRLTGDGLRGQTPFCAGEPILMTTNDYRRGIYNGDQGLVLKVRFEDQVRQAAVFPRALGFVPFPLEQLKHQLEHAFAMTVHKSQGSEYTRVAIVLPKNNHRALTKELLYTGLTRAKKSVILAAERERIPFAANNPTRRDSGLAERLDPLSDDQTS